MMAFPIREAAFLLLVGAAPGPNQAASSCVAAMDSMVAVLRRDYPGYRDGVVGHESAFTALIDSVRAMVRTSDDHQVCIGQGLRRIIHFFRDGHLMVWQASPPAEGGEAASPPPRGVAADDPGRPSFRVSDDSTAVLRLPDFTETYKPLIDSLIAANFTVLTALPYLIVDVRGNGGGYTGSYERVAALLYTNPIHFAGVDAWASAANVQFFRGFLTLETFTEPDKALFRTVIRRMESHFGEFVELAPERNEQRDTVYPRPRRVVVLVDQGCASTCEDFVLEAQQSRKVVVVGAEHTAGIHDYGNVRSLWLPGWRRMRVPTTRERGKRIDRVGLVPTVLIPQGEPDTIAFAQRYLRGPALLTQLPPSLSPKPDAPPIAWRNLIGGYLKGRDTIYVYEDRGALLMWVDSAVVPVTSRSDSVFQWQRLQLGPADGGQLRITPVRPVAELLLADRTLTPPAESGAFLAADLVEPAVLDTTIRLDIRYATTNNFLGSVFYSSAHAFLQRPAALALIRAARTLRPLGYGLLIHDAYRPWYVTKVFWDATPPALRWLVADPARGSKHNRGAAVDITLYDLATGAPVEMPSTYDEATPRASADFPGGTSLQRWHRALLRRVLEAQGFTVTPSEWWHFDFRDWQRYPILNTPLDQVGNSHLRPESH